MVSRRMRYHKTCSKTVRVRKYRVAASISAAFFACTLSNPADVIMTRWASAPTLGKQYLSIPHASNRSYVKRASRVVSRMDCLLCSSRTVTACDDATVL